MNKIIFAVLLVAISTACYYIPVIIAPLETMKGVPQKFYNFYAWKMAGAFFLTAVYAVYLSAITKSLAPKLIFIWLAIAETYTFINHVVRKMINHNPPDGLHIVVTLSIFAIFCLFFLYRAIFKRKSDTFRSNRTFIIYLFPKDLPGLLNYIFDHSGHKLIYEKGKIYGFKRSTGKLESWPATAEFLSSHDVCLKEVPAVKDIDSFLGRKFNLVTYNCNRFVKHATETQS